ncbi:carboxymuconolactone decarboxylase family protein [Streptomyces resistomycificus]|uniref:DNA-binding protein n=2 Tax=Streptomyces resistomycificus TaxID=67356 RepID=A0A0L8LY09_9ACTN|nr:carboxymuconolactone decarboxylase family protein [Streptomyces resistomycificus]KOG43063.1 DNA-binding protein [Streptomyces resistomycificus]KUO01307.1 DNA-binding protein [Streptomyces resistomycificus]
MPTPFRYTEPLPPRAATGRVAEVYAQLSRDFGIDKPVTFVVLSSAPEILAPAWALMRESLIAGPGSRTGKELAALGVSLANRCPFCVDAHTMLLHATGDHALAERLAAGGRPENEEHARVLDWGERTRVPGGLRTGPYPFPREHAPGYLGTALAFHFINRIVSALLTENLLPGNAQRFRAVRSLGGRALARTVRRPARPGDALTLLDPVDPGEAPAWAGGTPVGIAYAALLRAAMAGAGLLDADDHDLVEQTVQDWDGTHPPLALSGFPDRRERPGARLALLAALAPYRITDEDVAAWRRPEHTDHCLVHLVAYGAFLAVDRVESALNRPIART